MPSVDPAKILATLQRSQCTPEGGRILTDPSDNQRRLIPIIDGDAILSQVTELCNHPIVEIDQPVSTPRSYRDHLDTFIDAETVEQFADFWPMRHEILGDLILVKIPDEVSTYQSEIAQAMLTQHVRIRMVLKDEGVSGEYRVRNLTPLAERIDTSTNYWTSCFSRLWHKRWR